MAAPDLIYRRHLAGVHAGLLALLSVLWNRYIGSGNNSAALYTIGMMMGAFTVRGQARSVSLAQGYLGDVTGGIPSSFSIPTGLSTLAGGSAVMEIAVMAVSIYWRRIDLGATPTDALSSSRAVLSNLAASEPYRAANATVVLNARHHPAFTGRIVRVTRPGACEFCRTIADQGYTPAGAGFAAHRYCQCTAAPEVRTP